MENQTDNDLLKRQQLRQEEWRDSFGAQVSHQITNVVDVPSHYQFSPERLRYRENGTRTRPEDSAKFTDEEADWLIEPAGGDTLELFTAERPRYVVGTDAAGSLASRVTQPLQSGDQLRFGLDDKQSPRNAAYFEINGGSDNRIVLERGGTEVATKTWTYPDGLDETTPIRYEIQYNWYGVGAYRFNLFYTEDAEPINTNVGKLATVDQTSTNDGNFHILQEVTADAGTSGLGMVSGSMGYLVFGDASPTSRAKQGRIIGSTDNYSGTGDYEPLAAIRVAPDEANVFAQLASLSVVPSGGDGELIALVFDSDDTDASGFETPQQMTPRNTAIEQTTNVTEFKDESGNIVTNSQNPNGYQVAFTASDVTGVGASQTREASGQSREIRPLYEDDVCIFMYKADTATARTVNIVYETKQLW